MNESMRGDSVSVVSVPASVDEAVVALGGLGRLLNAKEWERAAIVAAFVVLDQKPGPKPSGDGDMGNFPYLTPLAFAAKSVVGMRDHKTVIRYVRAWESTGLPRPTPGAEVMLPDVPFPRSVSAAAAIAEVDPSEREAVREVADAAGDLSSDAFDIGKAERDAKRQEIIDAMSPEEREAFEAVGPAVDEFGKRLQDGIRETFGDGDALSRFTAHVDGIEEILRAWDASESFATLGMREALGRLSQVLRAYALPVMGGAGDEWDAALADLLAGDSRG